MGNPAKADSFFGIKLHKQASFFYPNLQFLEDVKNAIEQIKEHRIRKIVKICVCSGYRIGEILNCYLYKDVTTQQVHIRAPALKSFGLRKLGIKLSHQGSSHETNFIGVKHLNQLLNMHSNQNPIFKSNIIKNFLNLDLSEIEELISPSISEPRFVAKEIGLYKYTTAFVLLKKHMPPIPLKVRYSDIEEPITEVQVPAFHFFRKLYAALYYHYNDKNFIKTVSEMRWTNLPILLKYVKE